MIVGYMQPQIQKKLFGDGDNDGILDRHWVSDIIRKETYVQVDGFKKSF